MIAGEEITFVSKRSHSYRSGRMIAGEEVTFVSKRS